MSYGDAQARDAILALFNEAWRDAAPAALGGADVRVEWPGRETLDPPPVDAPWARVSIQFFDGGQRSLGSAGDRRFERQGIVTVQVFTPKATGTADLDALVKIARDAFEGTRTADGEVWFRHTRRVDIGQDGVWEQVNVLSEFSFEEVR